ncbi:MAG: bifunctional demethylmenaquinone methyltransferase/2-methoxy-6-polyprenyl-1,4-benzoquinol methylase UbiE [Silvanigrellaceae bacterium]|nr:bifunctional demethylmenaquinone methyltransferase/2-methoxy-6-polyprenyl-1,4-benzoquinol methylase UbiE [Silvanigrellaceae bacterium]
MENNLNLSEKSKKIQEMFDKISKRYDLLNRLLSFRQDERWRNALIKNLAVPNITQPNEASGGGGGGVLYDVACGTGDVLYHVEQKRQDYSTLIGFDISSGMLEMAKKRAETKKSAVVFKQASAESLPVQSNSADCVTISFGLRNVDDREKALQEFYRVLKPCGRVLILEFFPAQNSVLSFLFQFYFKRILPILGGLVSDKAAYQYLPKSVITMPRVEEFRLTLSKIGFACIGQKQWLSGAVCLVVGEKKI